MVVRAVDGDKWCAASKEAVEARIDFGLVVVGVVGERVVACEREREESVSFERMELVELCLLAMGTERHGLGGFTAIVLGVETEMGTETETRVVALLLAMFIAEAKVEDISLRRPSMSRGRPA